MKLLFIRFSLIVGLISIGSSAIGGDYKDLATAKFKYIDRAKHSIHQYNSYHIVDDARDREAITNLELEFTEILRLINLAETHPKNKNNGKLMAKIYLLKGEVFTDLAGVIKTMIFRSISMNQPVATMKQHVAGFTLHQAVETAQSAISNAYQYNDSNLKRSTIDSFQRKLNGIVNEFNKVFGP